METNNIHINNESDFTVVFTFPEGERPFYPWQLAFVAGRTSRYIASFDGEKYHNATIKECREDQIRVEFRHHRLGCGPLRYEFKREVPNELFSDGQQGLIDPYTSNITLHEGPSDDSPIPEELIPITQAALRGFSAYEIAVLEGFTGSESEWLVSLKGDKGDMPPLVQTLGDSKTAAMSQAATTTAIAEAVAAIPTPDVSGQISDHNVAGDAHKDIRRELGKKVDKIEGKGLSANDYTDLEKAEVAKIKGKADAQVVEQIAGAVVTIHAVGGHTYLCGELTSLSLTVEDSPREAVIRFRSGATATSLSIPLTLRTSGYWAIAAGKSYEISIVGSCAILAAFD